MVRVVEIAGQAKRRFESGWVAHIRFKIRFDYDKKGRQLAIIKKKEAQFMPAWTLWDWKCARRIKRAGTTRLGKAAGYNVCAPELFKVTAHD